MSNMVNGEKLGTCDIRRRGNNMTLVAQIKAVADTLRALAALKSSQEEGKL